jgi:hypothetical protein
MLVIRSQAAHGPFALPHDARALDLPKTLTRAQQEALSAIVFFRRQRKATRGWVISDKRLSEKLVRSLVQMDLVVENVLDGRPVLQLTPAGRAARAQLTQ